MLRIAGIDHLVLRTANVPRLVRFYIDVLGCILELEQTAIGLTQLRAGNGLIDLVSLDGPIGRAGGAGPGAEGRNLDHFCLRIDPFDAEAIFEHLRIHHVDTGPVEQRYGAEGTGPSIYVKDPDGNTVELKGPPNLPGDGSP
ncbi:Catechol 2,3-dioxygenase [Cupriavidus sp. OV038]|uniref:VOC family protein n=1 Tax=unclassified Cupriavidus TaxID=2640874 RepID=UPI0008E8AF4F|nr:MULTISPECIES: VOC family protein [unclassified Cupriavidus]SFD26953.1 Catechol 2,3-dioxygenase [Cupriavidus sp. OV038]SFP96613.1 Catechol 2,3-dioxygenase [Cupriavidus sp. OV096]